MSDLKIFTDNVELNALEQINNLVNQNAFKDCKVRIMPDVHAGSGCVIGFTADLGDKVIPNIVGVDIGCGMLTIALGIKNIDLKKLDYVIRKFVPNGFSVHEECVEQFEELKNLHCYRELKDVSRIEKSIGSLGGGNHFIEVDKDDRGMLYLIIHTGSRNLGKQVAEYYQNFAIEIMQGKDKLITERANLISKYKADGRTQEIQMALKKLENKFNEKLGTPKELCYLEGEYREQYLHDMRICQSFAIRNRATIGRIILKHMGIYDVASFETIHNYIDHESNIVRKGAISARLGELLLIPINMRDGCILGIGKGNEDWNCSAPHGAGRIMSRKKAKEELNVEEFRNDMSDIYTTCVSSATLDESPRAYKPIEDIVNNIGESVEIIKIIKPVYNFKAGDLLAMDMTINDFFKRTFNANEMYKKIGIYFQDTRPRIYCKDGFSMSVQASDTTYCTPRVTDNIYYNTAEIGFPSYEEPLINCYAESNEDYTKTVYGYVPCDIINQVIKKHGGIDTEKTKLN